MSDYASLFGGVLGSLISGLFGKAASEDTNKTNLKIANQNLGFQRENLDYEKALQQQIFNREDTAYQRTVNDMRLAGLNPVSMQGTNSAGEAIQTEPLHNDFQYSSAIGKIFEYINQMSTTRNNTTLTQAQANLINAQADNQKIKNLYEEDVLKADLLGIDLSNIGKRFENERNNIGWLNDISDLKFRTQFGITDSMPDYVKALNYATHQGNLKDDWLEGFRRKWDNDDFGKTFNYWDNETSPNFTNLQSALEKSNLKGALTENKIANALLKMLGIQ